jgi:hypothetical protein
MISVCESGSGIQCFFDPWIRDLDMGYDMEKNQDPGFFGFKILKTLCCGSGSGSGIRELVLS